MKKYLLSLCLVLSACVIAHATTYYVATDGSDANAGTATNAAFATPQKAMAAMAAGDTIYLRGGTYMLTTQVKPAKAGTAGAYCNLFAYPGERPILDFSGTPAATKALYLGKDYWHVKGIEVQEATDNGIFIGGGYLLIEGCTVHDCNNDGICLGSTSLKPHDCVVLNCDSYKNINLSTGGQDGDGYCGKDGCGPNNAFVSCRSWNNADDGWDFYNNATNFVTLSNCWSFQNGVDLWNLGGAFVGNGNGFKLGGAGTHAQHVLKNCMAFENVHKGFDQNYNQGGITMFNCTSYSNEVDYSFPLAPLAGSGTNVLKNDIAYVYSFSLLNLEAGAVQVSNSWQGLTVSAADFTTLDTSSATNARNADYSLPTINFLHLGAGSDLIDAGVDVGLPYNGVRPDLGAYEFDSGGSVVQPPSTFDLAGCGKTNGGYRLQLNGLSGHGPVILFYSTDGISWTPLATNPPAGSSSTFVDGSYGARPRTFYRAMEQ